jgi:hypothetical protein
MQFVVVVVAKFSTLKSVQMSGSHDSAPIMWNSVFLHQIRNIRDCENFALIIFSIEWVEEAKALSI